MGFVVAQDPRGWFQHYHPLFHLERIQPYYSILPDFINHHWRGPVAAWLALFTGSLFLGDLWRLRRPRNADAQTPRMKQEMP